MRTPESPTAVIEIEFTVTDMRSSSRAIAMQKKYRADVQASEASAPAIVAAWREAMTQVLTPFEADLIVSLSPTP